MTNQPFMQKFPSRYQIEQKLGEGALGEVYLATDLETNSKVVIKTLKQAIALFSNDAKMHVKRFYNEFVALKNCDHPNIIRVLDFCEYDRLLFFTMEYLDGKALSSLIPVREEEDEDDGLGGEIVEKPVEPVTPIIYPTIEEYIDYLFQMAQGLLCVHEHGMIHRDLKPDNVFLTSDKRIKLLDFGLARAEQSSVKVTIANNALGTPNYMPPEVLTNQPLDHLGDIYSFGILAYELLTRELPYQDKSRLHLSYKHALAEIPSAKAKNPEIPDWLDGMIQTCMQKDKKRRYQSMLEVVAVIIKNCPELPIDNELKLKTTTLTDKLSVERHKENALADKLAALKASVKRLALVFLMVMIFLGAWYSPIGSYSNMVLLRTLFAIRGPIPPSKDVVIVALDDLTYQHFGVSTRQPFPRKYWAQALEKIHATKPKVVIIDAYAQKEDDDEEANKALETAIAKGPTVLMKWEEENAALPAERRSNKNTIKYTNDPRFSKAAAMEIKPFVQSYGGVVMGIGLLDPKYKTINDQIPIRSAISRFGYQNLGTPAVSDFINFYGKPNAIRSVSMYEVISKDNDFKDKVVLVGYKSLARTDAPGTYDLFSASGSFSEQYFGIEVHATVASNLINREYIKRFSTMIEALFLSLFTSFFLLFLLSKRPSLAICYFIIILGVWFDLTVWAFIQYRMFIPGVSLMLFGSLFVCAAIWYAYGNAREDDLIEAEELTRTKLRRRID